jgi:hypothetical protein
MQEPLSVRRETLNEIFKGVKAAPIALSETLDASPTELVRVAREFGFEGIVPSARIPSMSPGSEPALGRSTRSTVDKSLSSAAIRRAIRLML